MPRYKALAALAFFGVLISASSVGSQDPFVARSEAESAASALPIGPSPISGMGYDPNAAFRPPVETVQEPVAVMAPTTITPNHAASSVPESPPPVNAVATPHAEAPAPFETAMATRAVQTPAPPAIPVTPSTMPAPAPVVAPKIELVPTTLPADRVRTNEMAAVEDAQIETAPHYDVAQQRLLATVPDDIESYFDLFMYVSKSDRGPLAQHMFIFQRDGDGKLIPYADWRVSTGREKVEIHHDKPIRTTTPEGVFSLDPKRFYARYWSRTWDGAPMHYAMFYDLKNNGNQSGLAIHAAMGAEKIRRLGRRDSAGCIRLSPTNAKELFYKIRNTTQGRVPAFQISERGSTDRWGRVQRDQAGTIILQDGYRALLFVENYDGRDEVVGPVVAYTN